MGIERDSSPRLSVFPSALPALLPSALPEMLPPALPALRRAVRASTAVRTSGFASAMARTTTSSIVDQLRCRNCPKPPYPMIPIPRALLFILFISRFQSGLIVSSDYAPTIVCGRRTTIPGKAGHVAPNCDTCSTRSNPYSTSSRPAAALDCNIHDTWRCPTNRVDGLLSVLHEQYSTRTEEPPPLPDLSDLRQSPANRSSSR